jgi:hypothetical protein
MRKVFLGVSLVVLLSLIGCEVLRDLNSVTVCSEVGLYVDTTKDGKYRVNGKEVTREVADSICVSIYNRAKK